MGSLQRTGYSNLGTPLVSKGTECTFLSISYMSGYFSQSGLFAKWDVRASTWAQEQPRCLRKGQSPSFSQFSFEPGGVHAPSPALAPLVPIVHFCGCAVVVLLLKPHPFPGGESPRQRGAGWYVLCAPRSPCTCVLEAPWNCRETRDSGSRDLCSSPGFLACCFVVRS